MAEDTGSTARAGSTAPTLAALAHAWTPEADGAPEPDWTRFRALVDRITMKPELTAPAIRRRPPPSGWTFVDCLLAAMAEKIADDGGIARPAWATEVPSLVRLRETERSPRMQARALAATPPQLAARNIALPAHTLWRDIVPAADLDPALDGTPPEEEVALIGPCLRLAGVAEELDSAPREVARLTAGGHLLALLADGAHRRYPLFQFVEMDWRTAGVFLDALRYDPGDQAGSWRAAVWLRTSQPLLDGRTPAEAIRDGDSDGLLLRMATSTRAAREDRR